MLVPANATTSATTAMRIAGLLRMFFMDPNVDLHVPPGHSPNGPWRVHRWEPRCAGCPTRAAAGRVTADRHPLTSRPVRRRRRSRAPVCAQPSSEEEATPPTGRVVLDDRDIARALTRISHEILERNK